MSHFKVKIKKFDFGRGSAPDPAGGAYSAPPEPQLYLREPTSKGRIVEEGKGTEMEVERGREGKRREKGGEGKRRKGRSQAP